MIEPLAATLDVVAPDLPGFGFSAAPPPGEHDYTFENLSRTIERFLDEIEVERFFLYVTDFGTPVGYHLATRHPGRIRCLIVQNGNAHEAGLGPPWDEESRAKLPGWMTFEGTKNQYVGDQPERLTALYPPEGWQLHWERLARPGNTDLQFEIFTDHRTHVARFPEIEAYHREHQPPCLLHWGRHDPYFDIGEIMAYHRVLDVLETHVFDSSHMLLELRHRECAALIEAFTRDVETGLFS